jgi:S-methylmethionine-dependent homocysteine/selenocysteine methylase
VYALPDRHCYGRFLPEILPIPDAEISFHPLAPLVIDLQKPLLLDGPMGTELERRGIDTRQSIWSARALIDAPELVERIHREYIDAGADIITVNSFRTGRRAVVRCGMDVQDARRLTMESVGRAHEARRDSGRRSVLVAGSDAPVEDSYRPGDVPSQGELDAEHEEHISWLVEAGCDLVLIETMNTLREATSAAGAACRVGAPWMISLVTDQTGGKVLSGESLHDAARIVGSYQPLAVLVNCASPRALDASMRILADVRATEGMAWEFGGYPNGGEPDPILGYHAVEPVGIEDFVAAAATALERGARVIGSCCGTTPAHTAALRTAMDRFVSMKK